MAGHPYVSQIQDDAAAKAVGKAFADISALQTRVAALEAAALRNTGAIACNGQRLTNVGTPDAESDAATVAFVRAYVQARMTT